MKCCDISAGELTRKITIQRKTRADDGYGGVTDTWATLATPFAKIKALSGYEQHLADRVIPGQRYRAVIRFRGDSNNAPYYTTNDQISYKGRTYAIETVVDVEERRKWLEITMVEGKKS